MKAASKSIVMLAIIAAIASGCKSREERIAERNAQASDEFHKQHGVNKTESVEYEETPEQRTGRAQWELQKADESGNACEKLAAYTNVSTEFADLPQGKIGARKAKAIEKEVVAYVSKMLKPDIERLVANSGKHLDVANKAEEVVATFRERLADLGNCNSDAITSAIEKVKTRLANAEAKMQANRLKYHGY